MIHKPSLSRLTCGALLLAALGACGDPEPEGDAATAGLGESCASSACEAGLLCIARTCRDPNEAPPDDMGGQPDADPDDMGADDTGADDMAPPDDMGAPDQGGPDQGEDAAPPEDMAPDMVDPDRPAALTGGVSVFEARIKANALITIRRGNAGAAFVAPTQEEEPLERFGDCALTAFDPNAQSSARGYDAGVITVTAGNREAVLTPATQGASTVYRSSLPESNEELFGNDQPIMISAGGGRHVGAFVGSLTSPREHSVISPAADSTIPAGALTVTWTPGETQAEVAITLSPMNQAYAPVAGMSLTCTTTDTGSLEIPAEAMTRLNAERIALVVIKVLNREVQVGDDTLYLNLTSASGNVLKR
jgi:hypothetical protein